MKKRIIEILLFTLALTSCQKILFRDEVEQKEISLDNFTCAEFSGIYDIILIQDSTNKLLLTGENGIDRIEAHVINDTLFVNDRNTFSLKPGRNILYLHFSNLEYLITNDAVKTISLDTLKLDRFYWDALGEISEGNILIDCNYLCLCTSANTLGAFHLTGRTESCDFFIRYGSKVNAGDLICRDATITSESIGDIIINATEYLTAYIWSNGNIYYFGNPQTTIAEQKGKGQLLRLNN